VTAPFETEHETDLRRDEYETEVLLDGCPGGIGSFAPTLTGESVNDEAVVAWLKELAPEMAIVFGTGLVDGRTADAIPGSVLNLHGGNPEAYRGLDTLLWAVYHRDFANLVTTLHVLEPKLDAGPIVFQGQIRLDRETQFHELRARNTGICLELTTAAASALEANGRLPSRDQLSAGRYYSFMPAVLKGVCAQNLERHVSGL
jgi:methionyl-tRNA formyltransferase